MGTTPTDSLHRHHHHHLQLNESTSTNRIDNLCTWISGLLADAPLPQELIIEILLRLPVKSLLKFRCVSKSWLSLISTPQFVRSHFSTSSEPDRCLYSQVLFATCDPIPCIKQFSIFSALYEPSFHVSHIEYPSNNPNRYPFIAGVVNGLVCLLGADGLLLWNPVLRKFKHLPNPNLTFERFMNHGYGFGYDESNDDYKVVFAENVSTPGNANNTAVKVYSLRTDSWRTIDSFISGILLNWCGTYANGKIHWIVRSTLGQKWKIVSLEMLSEKYVELQQPEYEAGVSNMVIGVSGGRLFVLCHYDQKRMDLWVMDKYGVVEVWSKAVSIPYHNVHRGILYSMHRVLCILRNGDIVLSVGSDFFVYHSKRNEFRKIELGGVVRCKFHVFVESLVSPHGSGL